MKEAYPMSAVSARALYGVEGRSGGFLPAGANHAGDAGKIADFVLYLRGRDFYYEEFESKGAFQFMKCSF